MVFSVWMIMHQQSRGDSVNFKLKKKQKTDTKKIHRDIDFNNYEVKS